MAAAHPHVELARRMVLAQDPDDHAAPAARAKFSRARPHQRRAVTVPLMRGEDVDRVDLAGMRVVADARRAAVAEADDLCVMFGDEREAVCAHRRHPEASARAVVPEAIEDEIG